MKSILKLWSTYRYRFTPWLVLNLGGQAKTRTITKQEEIVQNVNLIDSITAILATFKPYTLLKDDVTTFNQLHSKNQDILYRNFGFQLKKSISTLGNQAGDGIFLYKGSVKKGQIVAMYPGTIYQSYNSIFFQSISNQYILRCVDGCHIDGKASGLSGTIFNDIEGRDRIATSDGLKRSADTSWTNSNNNTTLPVNPLNCGQYVNNADKNNAANVTYCEIDLSFDHFPYKLKSLLPNLNYESIAIDGQRDLKIVVLLSTKEIQEGDELFSSYFTVVEE